MYKSFSFSRSLFKCKNVIENLYENKKVSSIEEAMKEENRNSVKED